MQHIVHVFIGDELVAMRNRFASLFQRLHPDVASPFLSILSLTVDDDGSVNLEPADYSDAADGTRIEPANRQTAYYNYFENLYSRKVTVATPGNRSLVVMLWTKLFTDRYTEVVEELIDAISGCTSNISAEISGFTHDSVTAFVTDPAEMLSPEHYRECFERNILSLRSRRQKLGALRLIANRNLQDVALGFDEEAMARACVEFSALMSQHYLTFRGTVVNSEETPFESFGISAIKFDRSYYNEYLLNRVIIDAAQLQNIDRRRFNINALAQRSNPVMKQFVDKLRKFYDDQVTNARAQLAVGNAVNASNIVGQVDSEIQSCVDEFRKEIDQLTESGDISIFEREALLSLILGDDCAMFDTSAVTANEIIIDDILDESAKFFLNLDTNGSILQPVQWSYVRQTRNEMRNIAVANRQREQRIAAIEHNLKEHFEHERHIDNGKYRFDGVDYNLTLSIDSEPLEKVYVPHAVTKKSVDLRSRFAKVRDQGVQGCCASFAVASVIEALTGSEEYYSPAFLYWNARVRLGDTSVDSGATIYTVLKGAMEQGDCLEDLMPYNAAVYNVPPGEAAVAEALKCRVAEAKTVEPTRDDIRSALADGYPVIVAARIFDSFSETRGGFVRRPSKKEESDGGRADGHGNHALVVCGYSDDEKVFVVRNSWGRSFGDGGYCYIPYSYADKYFLQACIITAVNAAEKQNVDHERQNVLQFNVNDANIEYAILRNQIDEDNETLSVLSSRYANLKAVWSQNIAVLGNVNNQINLVADGQFEIQKQIAAKENEHYSLQNTMQRKLWDYTKNLIWGLCISGIFALSCLVALYFDQSLVTLIATSITVLVFLAAASLFAWRRKVKRQELIDEIQEVARQIDQLRENKRELEIQAHIHGERLKFVGDVKQELALAKQRQRAFNEAVIELYDDARKRLDEMTPVVPYPFLTIVRNDCLSDYFGRWKDRMVGALNFNALVRAYTNDVDLLEMIATHPDVRRSIERGLVGFSMREYLSRTDPNRWQFLPSDNNQAVVLPNLDQRATPFCPYANRVTAAPAKYLFVNSLDQQYMSTVRRWFQHSPMPVGLADPDSIYLLTVVRYNL
ncbi:MAG: hypothetical protein HDR89_05980 [Bacteroides sp.]|nr:hypothetical protein [Bacteroides sp.]